MAVQVPAPHTNVWIFRLRSLRPPIVSSLEYDPDGICGNFLDNWKGWMIFEIVEIPNFSKWMSNTT
jgi:hypothetical protein